MTFIEHYRTHFDRAYVSSEEEFERYLPAYQFGRLQALSPHFQGRPFDDSLEDLRAQFRLAYPHMSFESVREAIRYAYHISGAVGMEGKSEMIEKMEDPLTGLGSTQIRSGERVQSTKEASKTSKSMSASTPQPGTPRGGTGGPE